MSKKLIYSGFLFFAFSLFGSCYKNKFEVDVSKINLDLKIQRFEKDLFNVQPENIHQKHKALQQKYGTFYQRYIENISGIGMVNDPAIAYSIKTFLSDKYVKEVFTDTENNFGDDLSDLESGLTDAFKYCRFYFPKMVVPQLITFVSGFQYSVAVTDSTLGIGLDMYLGNDYKNYKLADLPLYKIALMKREYIVSDAMKSWLMTEFFSEKQKEDVLGKMVQYGKIIYLMEAILPYTSDTIKMGYSKEQLDWCEKNEFNIWANLVDKQLLFSTDQGTITKFFNDGPFTSGYPQDSPAKLGIWVGWQIVRSYMENNPDVTIAQLMKIENAQELLNKSKYKPKR